MTKPERHIQETHQLLAKHAGVRQLLEQVLLNQIVLLQAAQTGYVWRDE